PSPIVDQFETWDWDTDLPATGELVLLCRRLPRQVNSFMREVDSQRSRGPHPTLLIHPADADRRDHVAGDRVALAPAPGSLPAVAEVTEAIRVGAVSLTHGWAAPNVNLLTSAEDVDPITFMPRYTGFPVSVSKGGPDADTVVDSDVAAWR